jgi:hypothetical protein
LFESGAVECSIANFEFHDENCRTDDEYRVNPSAHARDAELHEERAGQADQVTFQQGNLR